jgi:hypothetical protein
MLSPKRAAPLLCITAFTLTLLHLRAQHTGKTWRNISPIPADGDLIHEEPFLIASSLLNPSKPLFLHGTPKPPGSNYTRALVIASTSTEDVSWITSESLLVTPFIYVVDSPTSLLSTPANKGHEVMVYLTYIIDHFSTLPDITLFMHAHRHSWHNNVLLNHDAAEMIRRLSSEHVLRNGFVNLRCHWEPGCPDWMHPGVTADDINKQEETLMVQAWAELFPGEGAPLLLAQPCCAQFAVSRERIRARGLERWRFYREWLMRTELSDHLSGRIWEYLWQVVFTGEADVCPDQHVCYCDGYGVCFEDGAAFERWGEVGRERDGVKGELDGYVSRVNAWREFREGGGIAIVPEGEEPEAGREEGLRERVEALERELEEKRSAAVERGADARNRAKIAGRLWSDGDGF